MPRMDKVRAHLVSPLVDIMALLALALVAALLLPQVFQFAAQASTLRRNRAGLDALMRNPPVYDVSGSDVLRASLYDSAAERELPESRPPALIMVAAPDCASCEEAWRSWHGAFRASAQSPVMWYVVVGANGASESPIVPRLPNAVFKRPNSDVRVFSARTGVRLVPMTFVFGTEDRMQCVVSGVPDALQMARCVGNQLGPNMTERGTLFFDNITSVQLLAPAQGERPVARFMNGQAAP
jgi:hypothetical protein